MAIHFINWFESHLGCNITGSATDTEENIPSDKTLQQQCLTQIQRIATRLISLKADLSEYIAQAERQLTAHTDPVPVCMEGLKATHELLLQQRDVFTKQLYELDALTGDEAVRAQRKHVTTQIQIALKDIEALLAIINQTIENARWPAANSLQRKLGVLSKYSIDPHLDPQDLKEHRKVGKTD
eukprot:NODE_5723_length_619_cov_20.304878_g5559_i0.p1 GENE.NODE_5723_length_619_cov_20.304878_g5559_i0~~NODE_5723_length_619_cov_20.304878_g5559_i0.p1  ORF type:complete len:183 (-),score=47.73 NODE_5723_length_619_cov_20.304878_g5559_i0:55-603(-)